MTTALLISLLCYFITAVVSVLFGIIYLTRSEFMPYHAAALDKRWTELEVRFQTLILALMRAAGGGFLATGLGVILLSYVCFTTGEKWPLFVIPVMGLVTSLGSLYATLLVKARTPGSPPIKLALVSIGLVLIGIVLSIT